MEQNKVPENTLQSQNNKKQNTKSKKGYYLSSKKRKRSAKIEPHLQYGVEIPMYDSKNRKHITEKKESKKKQKETEVI